MVFIPNKSTADHLFEKAEQYFQRSRTDFNGRVRLDARGNVFMARAIELDVNLQNRANSSPLFSLGRDGYGQVVF